MKNMLCTNPRLGMVFLGYLIGIGAFASITSSADTSSPTLTFECISPSKELKKNMTLELSGDISKIDLKTAPKTHSKRKPHRTHDLGKIDASYRNKKEDVVRYVGFPIITNEAAYTALFVDSKMLEGENGKVRLYTPQNPLSNSESKKPTTQFTCKRK